MTKQLLILSIPLLLISSSLEAQNMLNYRVEETHLVTIQSVVYTNIVEKFPTRLSFAASGSLINLEDTNSTTKTVTTSIYRVLNYQLTDMGRNISISYTNELSSKVVEFELVKQWRPVIYLTNSSIYIISQPFTNILITNRFLWMDHTGSTNHWNTTSH